jgi:phage shock protein E
MSIFSFLFGMNKSAQVTELLADGAVILDVRTPGEFNSGHIKGAKNIDLGQLSRHVLTLKKDGKPVITYCRSGMRSANAASLLNVNGVKAVNGGSKESLQAILNKAKNTAK